MIPCLSKDSRAGMPARMASATIFSPVTFS